MESLITEGGGEKPEVESESEPEDEEEVKKAIEKVGSMNF